MRTLVLILPTLLSTPIAAQRLAPAADRTPAPAFDLPQVMGPTSRQNSAGRLASVDLKGSILILDLWTPGCVPCGPMHEALARIAPDLDSTVLILSVGLSDTAGARAWVAEHGGAPFPVALATREMQETFAVLSFPRTVIIDAQGRVAFDGHALGIASFLPRVLPTLIAERDGAALRPNGNNLN